MKLIAIIGLASLAGCAATGSQVASAGDSIGPADAIMRAAADPQRGVRGTFRMKVSTTGRQDGNIYLNSEDDYRDQRNLTVAILPSAQAQVAKIYGRGADAAFKGKTILVSGVAHRVTIWFSNGDGRRSDKYYYQTHVDVLDASQLKTIG
jgi:hypothetical protein